MSPDIDEVGSILYKTYIEGFDNALGGGIPRGHIVLITGSPGTMKSSLGYGILYYNALKAGIPGAYISLEQNRSSLMFQMDCLGFIDPKARSKVHVVDIATIRKWTGRSIDGKDVWIEVIKTYINHLRNTHKIELLVLDSLQAFKVIGSIPQADRATMFQFFEWLRDMGITVFIVSEIKGPHLGDEISVEEYLADGIIALSLVKVGKYDFHRRIRCVKMRGMHHTTSYLSLDIRKGRFLASPPM